MTGNGIVQFVLNRAEKLRRFLSGRYIVSRHGKNILDAQVHAPFAGTNVPNTLEQFIKVVRATVLFQESTDSSSVRHQWQTP